MNKKQLNTTALAFIGDAVYEIYVREHVIKSGQTNADKLHQMAVAYVKAESQAKIGKAIFDELSEDEQALFKRARNRKTTSKPKNVDPVLYKLATAFEALIGHLYLTGNKERLDEIIALSFAEVER